jgi:hypothetical protein
MAEDGKNGNGTQRDSLSVAMRNTATAVPIHPDMAKENPDLTMNEDYVVPVRGAAPAPQTPCGDGSDCMTRGWRNQVSATGSHCTGGVACYASGEQTCDNGTGTCKTVDAGGGYCQCICVH